MTFLCVPVTGSPVTVERASRAVTLAERGYLVTDLADVAVGEPDEAPAPARKPRARTRRPAEGSTD